MVAIVIKKESYSEKRCLTFKQPDKKHLRMNIRTSADTEERYPLND